MSHMDEMEETSGYPELNFTVNMNGEALFHRLLPQLQQDIADHTETIAVICANGETVHIPLMLLLPVSPLVYNWLQGRMTLTSEPPVMLFPDVKSGILEFLLEFLVGGEVTGPHADLVEMCRMALLLGIRMPQDNALVDIIPVAKENGLNQANDSSETAATTTAPVESDITHCCELCNKSFKQRRYLNHHMRQFHSSRLLQPKNHHTVTSLPVCPLCSKVFQNRSKLKVHMLTHTGIKPFKCNVCDTRFRQKSALTFHYRQRHDGRVDHWCDVCCMGFPEARFLRQHRSLHSDAEHLKCYICGKTFIVEKHLWTHVVTHMIPDSDDTPTNANDMNMEIDPIPDDYLESGMANDEHVEEDDVTENEEVEEDDTILPSDDIGCPEKLVVQPIKIQSLLRQSLERSRTHSEDYDSLLSEESENSNCTNIPTEENLVTVKNEIQGIVPLSQLEEEQSSTSFSSTVPESVYYGCDLCTKVFDNVHNIKRHRCQAHSFSSTNTCYKCVLSFEKPGELWDHFQEDHKVIAPATNSGRRSSGKPFVCFSCGKGFTQQKALISHELNCGGNNSQGNGSVARGKVHECCLCGKQFERKRQLELHFSTHTNVKNLSCPKCGKLFTNKKKHMKHIRRCPIEAEMAFEEGEEIYIVE